MARARRAGITPAKEGPCLILNRRRILAAALAAPLRATAQSTPVAPIPLEARVGALRLSPEPAPETPIWGFNGVCPGPILRARKDVEFGVRLLNRLQQPMALHFQGLRIANGMDGAAGLTREAVAPGGDFDYRFTPVDSGFYWYRPSAFPFAAEQAARGLRGMLIVDESAPPPVDLDLPLMIADWRLDDRHEIAGPFPDPAAMAGEGRVGDIVTTNGKAIPLSIEQRPGARTRLRLLNACNARLIALIFQNMRPLVVAIDGQPCDPFEPARMILPMGPGARFEVMVDLPAGDAPAAAIKLRGGGLRADPGGEPDRDLVTVAVKGDPVAAKPPIAGLGLNPRLPTEIKLQNARRLDIAIEGPFPATSAIWRLNGAMAADRPLFTARRNQPVALGFINKTPVAQSIHVHGHIVRILHLLDDGWEPYWRDTILVGPGKTARVAFVADNPGKWLIDSTILEHSAGGLRGWFEVA